MKQKYPAKILFSISMAIFGTIGVFTRLINLSSSEIALYRAVLAAIVIAIFLVLSKKNIFKGIVIDMLKRRGDRVAGTVEPLGHVAGALVRRRAQRQQHAPALLVEPHVLNDEQLFYLFEV